MFKSIPSTVIAMAVVLSLWLPNTASAGRVEGFNDYFFLDPKLEDDVWIGLGSWNIEALDGTAARSDGTPKASIILSLNEDVHAYVELTIEIPNDGIITFSWTVSGFASFESTFGYWDGYQIIAVNEEQGQVWFDIRKSETFGFLLEGLNDPDDPLSVTIRDFQFSPTEVIPEPSTFGLLSLGFAGLAARRFWRRRKKAGTHVVDPGS